MLPFQVFLSTFIVARPFFRFLREFCFIVAVLVSSSGGLNGCGKGSPAFSAFLLIIIVTAVLLP